MFLFLFFFTNTATAEIYTLSLHDALPIWREDQAHRGRDVVGPAAWAEHDAGEGSGRAQYAPPVQEGPRPEARARGRSEEHTSELQSRGHLVCRLLLEKKKHKTNSHARQAS